MHRTEPPQPLPLTRDVPAREALCTLEIATSAITKLSTRSKLGRLAGNIVDNVKDELVEHARLLQQELKVYPIRPPRNPITNKKWRYKRTYNLKNNWFVDDRAHFARGGVIEVLITNDVADEEGPYAELVQNKGTQRPVHQIVWAGHTAQEIRAHFAPRLNGRIHSVIRQATR